MDRSEAWQMAIGNPTPEKVAATLGAKTPEAYVDEAISECASACAGEQTEEEIQSALEEHRDWMIEQLVQAKESLPNRAEQAVEGLSVTAAGGVVLVDDGHAKWLAFEQHYDAAYAELERLPALKDDEGGGEAYSQFCNRVGGPVACVDGGGDRGSVEKRHALIRQALDAGLIDEETARRMGLKVEEARESAAVLVDLTETDEERVTRLEQDARVRRMAAVKCGFMARDREAERLGIPSAIPATSKQWGGLPADYAYNDAPLREYARSFIALYHMEMGAPAEDLPLYEAKVSDEEIDLFVAVVRG